MKPQGAILMTLVMALVVINLDCVECKTVSQSKYPREQRKLENFVEFTDEGDQLAVESTGIVQAINEPENKREILGKKTMSTTGRQCPNVQKAVYPVIPVIIASLIGLIGAIIISAIVRLVFRSKHESDDDSGYGASSEYGLPSHGRRVGKWNMFGYDLSNVNYFRLVKNVLSAIEKVY